jgi:hypothetical protein
LTSFQEKAGWEIMADKPFVPPTFTEQFERVPPDTLYHYTGPTGLVGIVQKEELWATKIQYMNDATEFGLAIRLARGVLTNMIDSTHHSAEKNTQFASFNFANSLICRDASSKNTGHLTAR